MNRYYLINPGINSIKVNENVKKIKQLIASNDDFELEIVEKSPTALVSPLLQVFAMTHNNIKIVKSTTCNKNFDTEYKYIEPKVTSVPHKKKYDVIVRTSDKWIKKKFEEARGNFKTKFKYNSEVLLMVKCFNIHDFKAWMKWHLEVLKFDHAVILDNESPVDLESVCKEYGSKVFYKKIIGWPDQYHLYDNYVNHSDAKWVIPIDDDEYIFIRNGKDINDFLRIQELRFPCMNKLSLEWLNLFPAEYTKSRSDQAISEIATCFCHEAVEHWQSGDRQVKTFVHTKYKYEYVGHKLGHNPMCLNGSSYSYTIRGARIQGQTMSKPANPAEDQAFLIHYQFRTEEEWARKCKLGSPGSKWFSKIKTKATIEVLKRIYKFKNKFVNFTKVRDKLNELNRE